MEPIDAISVKTVPPPLSRLKLFTILIFVYFALNFQNLTINSMNLRKMPDYIHKNLFLDALLNFHSPSITILPYTGSGFEALVPEPAGALGLGHAAAGLQQQALGTEAALHARAVVTLGGDQRERAAGLRVGPARIVDLTLGTLHCCWDVDKFYFIILFHEFTCIPVAHNQNEIEYYRLYSVSTCFR